MQEKKYVLSSKIFQCLYTYSTMHRNRKTDQRERGARAKAAEMIEMLLDLYVMFYSSERQVQDLVLYYVEKVVLT